MKIKILFIFLLITSFAFSAQSPKVRSLENQRKKALAEIEKTNEMLKSTSLSKKNVLHRLNLLTEQIITRKKVIKLLNEELDEINREIKSTESDIKILEKELSNKRTNYAKSVQQMAFHKNKQNQLLFILSADDFSQSYRRMRYLKEYSDWQRKQSDEIKIKQEDLEIKKNSLAVIKDNKSALLQEREVETGNLEKEEVSKQKEAKDLTAQEKQLQRDLDKKRKRAEELNRQIEKVIAEEIARSQAEAEKARKANEKKTGTEKREEVRKADVEGGYAMTAAEKKLSSNFADNKGRLPFPLKGSYKIVGRFGAQQHEGLKYVTTNNNGIEIKTTSGNEARAVFDGVISAIILVPGSNNLVIVRHGNYLTAYGNLDNLYVKKGDKVSRGQSLGKIYTDPDDGNSCVLHFEIRKEKNKLNPETWLSR